MKKSRILVLIISVLLAVSLTACSTVTVVIPYEMVSGYFSGSGTGDKAALPADSDSVTTTPDSTSPSAEASSEDISSDAGEADAPSSDAAATQDTTSAPAAENTTSAPAADTTAAPASSAPSTKDEIIAYYVAAYNKIATDASAVTRTYDYTSNYNNILEINNNSTLEGIASSLMKQFMVENTEAVAGSASDLPPVGITKLSISSAQVGNATISDKGTYYEITLTSTGTDSNYEIDTQPGSGSVGVIGPLLRADDVAGAAGGFIKFDGLHSWYATAKVTATIDKASGHITELKYVTPCVLHFDSVTAALVVKVSNCNIGLLFQQNWKVSY